MFLKSVELFGFKSFAEKSRIEISEGISALLGPNGCGKSNIVDAIKWVLGEQSTRTLRADKMEDVIFNGTEFRKALNVAEVTLTLSNDEGRLPIDLPEIAVKRRLYRSGESEYFINNIVAKLRDVKEMFFDTGIGKSSYSVMEQGKIDQILSSKPEERRYIFEEAAGITKYKVRGAEADRKLLRTEENMKRVESILKEVKRSHDTLKMQAENARTYRTIQEQIFDCELQIALLKLRGFLEDQERKQDRLENRNELRDKKREKIKNINESLEQNLDTVNSMESDLIEKQKKLYGLQFEKNNLNSQVQIQKERIEELNKHIAGRRERETTIENLLTSLNENVEEKSASLQNIINRLSEIEDNIGSFEQNIAYAQERIKGNEASIESLAGQVAGKENQLENLRANLRELYDDIVTQLDARLKETGYSLQAKQESQDALYNSLNSLTIHLAGRVEIVSDALSVTSTKPAEKDRLLATSLDVLKDSLGRINELKSLLDTFTAAVPDFIDDFLAPEGIITKKRDIDKDITQVRSEIQQHRRQSEELSVENKHLTVRIEEYRKTLEDLKLNSVRMKTQKSSLEEAVALLLQQKQDHEEQLLESRREIEDSHRRLEQISSLIEELKKKRKEIDRETASIEKMLNGLESGIADRNRDLMNEEKKLKSLRNDIEELTGNVEKLQMDLAAIRTDIKNLYENFTEQHSRDLKDYQSNILEISTPISEYRVQLTQARDKMKSLGQVNLMAPEEYDQVKERYEFLTTQMSDLQKARMDLKTVTEQIKNESIELFLDTYEKIKRNFHTMFRRLFGGGRAEVTLTDPKSILTSGIEILAQPPGKKLEGIDLLSGGEKSLTAVALLFATYMVKPSPFCVLDEIDAALDEENVGRFIGLLKEFSQTSQFIIITHNKRTIASAETLLGITMEESGVSRVISVRLGAREAAKV